MRFRESRRGPLRAPGEHAATDLLAVALASPLTATTAGRHSNFSGCGATAGRTFKFYAVLPPGKTLTVGQTSNAFDSKHSVFWSESADPTVYPSGSEDAQCVDDPDTRSMTMTNAGTAARKAWFVVGGYSASEAGAFTLAWTISSTSPPAHAAPALHTVPASRNRLY